MFIHLFFSHLLPTKISCDPYAYATTLACLYLLSHNIKVKVRVIVSLFVFVAFVSVVDVWWIFILAKTISFHEYLIRSLRPDYTQSAYDYICVPRSMLVFLMNL